MKVSLTRAEARRIALAAQGFTGKKAGTVAAEGKHQRGATRLI